MMNNMLSETWVTSFPHVFTQLRDLSAKFSDVRLMF